MNIKRLQRAIIPIAVLLLIGAGVFSFLFQDKHVAEGRRLYFKYCSPCHGISGSGDGYNAVNLDPRPRDLTDRDENYMANESNKDIYEVLDKGGIGVDISPTMPTFGHTLSPEEMWDLVAYIRTLHRYKGEKVKFSPDISTKLPRAPAIQPAEFEELVKSEANSLEKRKKLAEQGKQTFSDEGCIGCHRIGNEGGKLGPDLSRAGFMLQEQYIYRWIRNPQSFKPNTRMPNLGLSKNEALAIVLYLGTLKGEAQASAMAK
jgi:mono/diheme cytochrome c family protein